MGGSRVRCVAVKILFVKQSLAWPRSSGHDVHTFHLMKACAELGHEVAFASVHEPRPEALAGLRLVDRVRLDEVPPADASRLSYTNLQERYRSFWGVERRRVASLRATCERVRPDAVVIAGLEALGYLPGVPPGMVRVWYAADEWVRHHLSLVRLNDRSSWIHAKAALLKGVYERVYAPLIDRAWVVSTPEAIAMRRYAGVGQVDVLPNGVDFEHYAPGDEPDLPYSAVFWGRLDFEPNVQGLEWFVTHVWPEVIARVPAARFTVIGFSPTPSVQALCRTPGVELLADLDDLRAAVGRREVVVLPFVTGGGIKNKLLEAAAMAKPIICTARAAEGIRNASADCLTIAASPAAWAQALQTFWQSPQLRNTRGAAARAWVVAEHSWARAAGAAISGLEKSLARRGRA